MKGAARHWLFLRAASLPLAPLFFYFIMQMEYLTTTSRMGFIGWVAQPATTTALVVFILCSFFHGCLGVEDIIEDYIPPEGGKRLAKLANKAFFIILGLACLYAVLTISFGKF